MNFTEKIQSVCRAQNSLLCVGLDSDISRIPDFLQNEPDPIFAFNKVIIDATAPFAAAFKPNLAFYEAQGTAGWQALEKTMKYMPEHVFTIADAKRGDIGNTARQYAKAFFEHFKFDAVTVNPYLGLDSIAPFIENEEQGVFILCLTSNKSSQDFQHFSHDGQPLYRFILEKVNGWNEKHNCGVVVGATHPDELQQVRDLAPELPFLIPGIGAQGGDVELSVRNGTNSAGELALYNSSRGIIFKTSGTDFGDAAAAEARSVRDMINQIRERMV